MCTAATHPRELALPASAAGGGGAAASGNISDESRMLMDDLDIAEV